MASNGPNDFGTFEVGEPISASALQRMSNRTRQLTPITSMNGPNVVSLPRAGTAIGKQFDPRKVIQVIKVKLTTILTEKGKYAAKRIRGLPDADATGDLLGTNLGVEDDDETIVVYNPAEADGAGTPLTVPSAVIYVEVGTRKTDTGELVCTLISSGDDGSGCKCKKQGQLCGAIVDLQDGCFYPRSIALG